MSPAKLRFQRIEIEMRKNDALGFRQTHAVDQAGMIGAVRENYIVRPQNCAQQTDIRRIAGSKIKRSLSADPSSEIIFDRSPSLIVSGQQARSRGRDSRRSIQRIVDCLFHSRIGGQTEIIVRPEIDAARSLQMAQLRPRFQIGKFRENALLHFQVNFTAVILAKRQRFEAQRAEHGHVVFRFRIRRGKQFFANEQGIRPGNETKRDSFPR